MTANLHSIQKLKEKEDPTYRILPHNQEAEQGLLGVLLVDNRTLEKVGDFLKPKHFFMPVHQRIYEAIIQVIDRGQVASPITLKGYFEQDEDLKTVGGAEYLADLAGSVVNVLNAEDYGRVIYNLHLRRQLITLGEEVVNKAYDINIDTNPIEILESHESELFSLAEYGVSENTAMSFRESVVSAIAMAETAFNSNGSVTGVSTGLTDIDSILGGLHPTDLIILAGRPYRWVKRL